MASCKAASKLLFASLQCTFQFRCLSCSSLYIHVLATPSAQLAKTTLLMRDCSVLYSHPTASSRPQLSVMQYPQDASVLLNSTVWMLCVFEYPSEEKEEPVVYWRKGPECHNQPSLQTSPSTGRAQVQITKNILRGFSILKLSNIDQNASNSYFCDVMLTEKIQSKCGNGTKLTVHGKERLGVTKKGVIENTLDVCKVK